ncbi:MAG TPA: carboxypeptidase regulatory-like domain-containing protein, partial [Gemmatimonadaceae bacterium]|nr:carboxypeptidase regulatory-like domain-containing protein [Gemmatimonadaceae bacterium]
MLARPWNRLAKAAVMAATSTVGASRLGAQTFRGTVVDPAGQPVVGVIATLLDSASTVVARALSDATGQFRLSAPRAGVYRVRTLRIGYRPSVSGAMELAAGADATRRLVLDAIPLSLDTVRVDDRSVCRLREADSTAIVFEAWEQVRAALTATQLTPFGHDLVTTTVAFQRALEPSGNRVRKQDVTVRTGYAREPWLARDPDSLRRGGYVVASPADSATFYAPGLDMLSSPAFVEDHCLRLGHDRDATVLAIEFEPTRERRKVPEIKGTMWLDRASSELRRLEFSYVNIPSDVMRYAGGQMRFTRMRGGGWVITRWSIQMPVFDQPQSVPSFGMRSIGRLETRVAEIRVAGGALTAVVEGSDTLWSHPPVTLAGTVSDSVSHTPVANARVSLKGTRFEGRSDERGRYSIEGVLPGEYTAELRTPALDSINALQVVSVVVGDTTTTVDIRAVAPRQFEIAMCGDKRLDEPGIVAGVVRIGVGDSLPANARVTAAWSVLGLKEGAPGQGVVTRERRTRDARIARDGSFRLCGVPVNTALSVVATGDGAESPDPTTVTIPAYMRYARAEVSLARIAADRAVFSGTVLIDSTTQPIAGAQVV